MSLRAVCLVTAACLACVGCGVPRDGTTQVTGAAVPYRLLEPAPAAGPPPSTSTSAAPTDGPAAPTGDPDAELIASLAAREPTTYLVDADAHLRPFDLEQAPGAGYPTGGPGGPQDPVGVAGLLVRRLGDGPSVIQRAAGLSTTLGPGVPVTLVDVVGDTARVHLRQPDRDPAADRLPLAVGQVVLTVTSAPGVERVQFLTDGRPAAVPLPTGARSPQPVTALDYAVLLAPTG